MNKGISPNLFRFSFEWFLFPCLPIPEQRGRGHPNEWYFDNFSEICAHSSPPFIACAENVLLFFVVALQKDQQHQRRTIAGNKKVPPNKILWGVKVSLSSIQFWTPNPSRKQGKVSPLVPYVVGLWLGFCPGDANWDTRWRDLNPWAHKWTPGCCQIFGKI